MAAPRNSVVDDLVALARAAAKFERSATQYDAPDTESAQKAIFEGRDSDIDSAFERLYHEGPTSAWFALQHLIDLVVDSPWVPDAEAGRHVGQLCQTVAFPILSSNSSLSSEERRSGGTSHATGPWSEWLESIPSRFGDRRISWYFDAFLHPGSHYLQLASSSLCGIQRTLGSALLSDGDHTNKPRLSPESFGDISPSVGSPEFFLLIGVLVAPFERDLSRWPQTLSETLYSPLMLSKSLDPLFGSRLERAFGVAGLRILPATTISRAIQDGRAGRRDLSFIEGVSALQESNKAFGPAHHAIVVPAIDTEGHAREMRFSLLDSTGKRFLGGVSFELLGLEPAEEAMQRFFACCESLKIAHVDSCESPVNFSDRSQAHGFAHPTSSPGRSN